MPGKIAFFLVIPIATVLLYQNCSAVHEGLEASGDSASKGSTWVADEALEAEALSILERDCLLCHSTSFASGGVADVTDVEYLIDQRLITPGDPDQGRLIGSLEDSTMPQTGPMAQADIDAIRAWVASFTEIK